MAALDFPASPTVGQLYPTPAVPGVPVYKWDGEKWTTLGGALGSTGASDAIPQQNAGAGAAGSSTLWTRGDHAHPATAPTPPPGDNDTSIATTAFVSDAISTAVGGIPGAPSAVVRYDIAQSLTDPQSAQARKNIYAAPFDAMAYSGIQVNGGMEVSQELGAGVISVAGTAKYVVDGWQVYSVGAQVMSCQQNPTAPGGFNSVILVAPTTASPTPAAGDVCTLMHKIEGYRCARLQWGTANAQPITLSFWVDANRPGNYSGSITNSAANRSYPFTFTVNAATTWEYKTITIPGCTDGTWAKDNTTGLQVFLSLMVGTNLQGAAGAWTNINRLGVTGSVNGVAATSDFMLISGVTVIPGNEGPSAARSPFIMRPYDQEIITCQRYWRWLPYSLYNMAYQAEQLLVQMNFGTPMRAAPTIGTIQPDPVLSGVSGALNNAANQFTIITNVGAGMQIASAAAGGCYVYGYRATADARL